MNAKNFAVALGIAIFFYSSVNAGVNTISPAPQWQDYQVKDYCSRVKEAAPAEKEQLKAEKEQLEQKHKDDLRIHATYRFSAAFPLGVAALLLGGLLGLRSVGAGLMFGGLLTLFTGHSYNLAPYLQLISSLTALAALIILGATRLADRDKQPANPGVEVKSG
jgi:hypothetical protein